MTARSEATRAAVIGEAVEHSLSPALHRAAYAALGLDWHYHAWAVPPGRAADAVAQARNSYVGLSVTMPHKAAVVEFCDGLSDEAATLRSVNTLTFTDGRIEGSSTDGEGFLRSLAAVGRAVDGRHALVIGAGGAARAVAAALRRAGAAVTITGRRPDAADQAAAIAGVDAVGWLDRDDTASRSELVVNATPIGTAGSAAAGELPIEPGCLRSTAVVVDLVYHPLDTPLLRAARGVGAVPVDGLGMLVHQAALQVELWTGLVAPIVAMRRAAEAELSLR